MSDVPCPLKTNYDYGQGLFSKKYKSVTEFLKEKRRQRKKKCKDLLNLSDEFLKDVVKEASLKDQIEELRSLATDPPQYFFSMTEVNKLGINPQSKFNTPFGIYAYPLTPVYFENLKTGHLPFAGDRPYVNIFKLKKAPLNLDTFGEDDLHRITMILLTKYRSKINELSNKKQTPSIGETLSLLFQIGGRAYHPGIPASRFWNTTRELSGSPLKWNGLLRELGYQAIYDSGNGIIHNNEPAQVVVLDPMGFELVSTKLNPYSQRDIPELRNKSKHKPNPKIEGYKKVSGAGTALEVTQWYEDPEMTSLHRDGDLPAVEYKMGDKEWWNHGLLHRVTGPAIVNADGSEYYYLNGNEYTEKQWKDIVKDPTSW